jgi:drug/metabolite transporter (DMT)-like permease
MAGSDAKGDQRTLALVSVAFTVVVWGCSNVLIKGVSVTGQVASLYRLWFAVPLVWALPLFMPSLRRHRLHQLLFFTGLKFTSVANVTIIGALQPVLVLLVAGRMFGERPNLRALCWSAVAFAGTAVVVAGATGAAGGSAFGDLLAVGNLFAFTGYFLWSKRIRTGVGATEYVIGMTTVAAIVALAVALATTQDLGSPTRTDLLWLALIAVVPGTLGHFLTNWAHAHASAFAMSVLLLAVPVVASALAAVFLDERLTGVQIGGGALTLLAVGVIVRSPVDAGEELAESAARTDAP